jgi:hypothetical protein
MKSKILLIFGKDLSKSKNFLDRKIYEINVNDIDKLFIIRSISHK